MTQLQSEFVSLVSHEFRNPLSIIKATSDVLKRVSTHKTNPELFFKQMQKIDNAVMRMSKLIETTLSLSRLESGKLEFSPTLFCLKGLLLEISDRYKEIDLKADFTLNIETRGKLFRGDKNLIDQVITNLISNAIKYSKNSAEIAISCNIEKQNFVLSVADKGIGMSAEDLQKLFTKFFRSKNTIGIAGTGIGLYLVKQFIALHNGKIEVKSQLNQGSNFIIYLPIT